MSDEHQASFLQISESTRSKAELRWPFGSRGLEIPWSKLQEIAVPGGYAPIAPHSRRSSGRVLSSYAANCDHQRANAEMSLEIKLRLFDGMYHDLVSTEPMRIFSFSLRHAVLKKRAKQCGDFSSGWNTLWSFFYKNSFFLVRWQRAFGRSGRRVLIKLLINLRTQRSLWKLFCAQIGCKNVVWDFHENYF